MADGAALAFAGQRVEPVPVGAAGVVTRLHQRHRRRIGQPLGIARAAAGSRCTPPGRSQTHAPATGAAPEMGTGGTDNGPAQASKIPWAYDSRCPLAARPEHVCALHLHLAIATNYRRGLRRQISVIADP